MTSRTEPSNATLLKKIQEIQDEQKNMRTDVNTLIEWKRGIEIGKAAVDEYKAQQAAAEQRRNTAKESKTKTDVLKQVGIILGIVAAILYAYASAKGYI